VPSGSATGTDEPWSLIVTLGLRPVFGSTPVGAPWRQLVARTPQPSFRSSRIRKVHFGVRFEFRATSDESLEAKCARLTTKMVPPGPIAGGGRPAHDALVLHHGRRGSRRNPDQPALRVARRGKERVELDNVVEQR